MSSQYPLLFGVFFSALAARMLDESTKRSGRLDPRNRPVFLSVFVVT